MTTPSSAEQGPANSGGPNQTASGLGNALGQVFNPANIIRTGQQVFNSAFTGFLGEGIDPAIQPQNLKTFVYSPEVKIIIAHNVTSGAVPGAAVQYDVSADLVRCQLVRPENSAATFVFTLHNKDTRYTPKTGPRFSRMDRIVVYMKKTGWNQVFSGYLDTVPYRQLYPGTVDFKATCTIKRLMHTWFNPDLPESNRLLNQWTQPGGTLTSGDQGAIDSGLGSLLAEVLKKVGGWDASNIHIQNFPMSFFSFMGAMIRTNGAVSGPAEERFKQMMLGSDTTPGPGAYAGHNPNAGTPGPAIPGAGVAANEFYISQIVAACDEKGLGPLVSDNNLSAGLAQAGETGASSGGPMQNPGQQKAWQIVQQTNLDAQEANRDSDAAILGTAAAMTLGGGMIRNVCNPAVPGSDLFPNDGPGYTGTGVGIFALPNSAEWGDLAQRMNPKQAAGMFMAHIAALTGGNWRNMNPNDAIQQALRSDAPFDGAIQQATELVQSFRVSQAGTVSSAVVGNTSISAGSSPSSVADSVTGNPGTNPNMVVGAATNTPNPVINPGVTSPTRTGKPEPDSEGAINWGMTQIGRPDYDCSRFVSQAFKSIGVFVPAQTDSIRDRVPRITPNTLVQRGDLVEPTSGHVAIWCGDGTIIESPGQGQPVVRRPSWIGDPNSWDFVGRACANGGEDPSAPFNPPETMGPGSPPGALDQQGGLGVGSGGVQDGVGRNMFSYIYTSAFTSDVAAMFTGKKAFLIGAPLIQMVTSIAASGLRSWSSAPNGDFMAWYPDYWGLDGKPCVLRLEDIELTDVNIQFTDDALTTHVYVAGDQEMGTGQGELDPVVQWLSTQGVVTCEDEQTWLYQRLIQIAPPDENLSGDLLLRRYGVRPFQMSYAMAGNHDLEFMLAMKVFMHKWAEQYKTSISMTFMPELFPGMRVELGGNHNLQVYVSEVTHVCDYESGFYTTATILAPSVPMAKKAMAAVQTVATPDAFALAFSRGNNEAGVGL